MKLYSYWRSTAAYRVRIALNLKRIEHEIYPVDLLQPKDSDAAVAYRRINPQGLVPALVTADGTFTQSTAIIEYLEERYPEPSLLPKSFEARARVRSLCQLIACDIHPLNNLRVLQRLRGTFGLNDDAVDNWYQHWVAQGFAALETLVARQGGTYCFGNEITMADVYLSPQMFNARRFECDLDAYPRLLEIVERLDRLPAFIQAAPEQQVGAG